MVWFSYRQRLLQVWQTEELAPTLSNILGASVWVALTSVIILEGVVVMVLFAPGIMEKLKEKGRVEGRAEGLEKGRAEGLEQGLEKGRAEGLEQGVEKGRAEGLEQGVEKGRAEGLEEGVEKARQEYEPQLEEAQARIAALEAQVRASNNGESDKG